jgi:type VI secretion system protein ImpE
MTAREHFDAGRLSDAVAAAAEDVKKHPTDVGRRSLLAELLCFAGDLERADRHLEALGHDDPATGPGIALFRQLIRAEQARQQFHAEGRVPEFVEQPTPVLRLHLEASVLLREGKPAEAAGVLARAEAERPHAAGTRDGRPFDDLRDLDDLTAPLLEVLAANGKYYWVPLERVRRLTLHAPTRPRDLLWRRAHLTIAGGPEGDVYVPALYAGSHAEADDRLRLGRATEWRGGDGVPVRGAGQRMFLVGEDAVSVMELQQIVREDAGTPPTPETAPGGEPAPPA